MKLSNIVSHVCVSVCFFQLRNTVVQVTGEHQETIRKMECRFVREKRRIEEDATRQLNMLIRQAHAKAIK